MLEEQSPSFYLQYIIWLNKYLKTNQNKKI